VTDVEERRLGSRPEVRLDDTEVRILYRHVIPTKRNHFAAVFDVEVIERGFS